MTRKEALGQLAAYFPLGASLDRSKMYLENRDLEKVDTRDLVEGVERLCVVHREKSFPPLALLLVRCADARALRLGAERSEDARNPARQGRMYYSEAEIAQHLAEFRRLRAIQCPKREKAKAKVQLPPGHEGAVAETRRLRLEREARQREPERLGEILDPFD